MKLFKRKKPESITVTMLSMARKPAWGDYRILRDGHDYYYPQFYELVLPVESWVNVRYHWVDIGWVAMRTQKEAEEQIDYHRKSKERKEVLYVPRTP